MNHFSIYFYIGYKEISVYGKNQAGPMKSLGAKFHCTMPSLLSIGPHDFFRTARAAFTGIFSFDILSILYR